MTSLWAVVDNRGNDEPEVTIHSDEDVAAAYARETCGVERNEDIYPDVYVVPMQRPTGVEAKEPFVVKPVAIPSVGAREVAVNEARTGDRNVVVSFNAVNGRRDAIGFTPPAARRLAMALLSAAESIADQA